MILLSSLYPDSLIGFARIFESLSEKTLDEYSDDMVTKIRRTIIEQHILTAPKFVVKHLILDSK